MNKDYLLCDYNRDGDSYRSPWSNEFFPPIEDGNVPSDRMRKLEEQANDAFDVYREQYFDGGISSCYFWDEEHGGFSGAILIKKTGDLKNKFRSSWDSIHVIEVHEKGAGRNAHYKLISTVMLWLQNTRAGSGQMDLGGSLSRQVKFYLLYNPPLHFSHSRQDEGASHKYLQTPVCRLVAELLASISNFTGSVELGMAPVTRILAAKRFGFVCLGLVKIKMINYRYSFVSFSVKSLLCEI
eukprot:sb/3469092/